MGLPELQVLPLLLPLLLLLLLPQLQGQPPEAPLAQQVLPAGGA